MNSLEEDWFVDLYILDSWGAWHDHLRTVVFSLLLFSFYGFFLLILCSSTITPLAIALLFGSQVLLGLPAVRGYSDLGLLTREKLRFFDSVMTNNSASPNQIKVDPGNVPLIFERLAINAQKYDRSRTDDFNDLAWFIVLVWAILSTALFSFELINPQQCAFLGDLVLMLGCFLGYLGGYWTQRGISFEDQVNQLEYFTIGRLKAIDKVTENVPYKAILLVESRLRHSFISDFLVELNASPAVELEYRLGLPSAENERFILDAPDALAAKIKGRLESLESFSSGNWLVEEMKTQKSKILRAVNKDSIDISKPVSFLQSPDKQASANQILQEILSIILEEISIL